ncbi:MAG: hypothetical protein M3Q23_11495 [Actinomycetota bacterium]|nr:hypothetical protein [Actinomycetota bacterium]
MGRPGSRPAQDDAILFAVMDDVRHTLRTFWIDPALRSVSSSPVFFTAAWAATKPNMTRSFALGTERVRLAAIDAVQSIPSLRSTDPPSNGSSLETLGGAERERLIRTVQAVHHASAKVAVILHAWTALALRRRVPGTGQEEPPAKRGIPSWQEGLGTMPRSLPSEAEALVDDATIDLGLSTTPTALHAIGTWPRYLEESWRRLIPATRSVQWTEAIGRLRRSASDVLRSLPHPMDLQWDVLARRGLSEERREALADHLAALGAAMPVNMLVAAHLWVSLGSPEPPGEG